MIYNDLHLLKWVCLTTLQEVDVRSFSRCLSENMIYAKCHIIIISTLALPFSVSPYPLNDSFLILSIPIVLDKPKCKFPEMGVPQMNGL